MSCVDCKVVLLGTSFVGKTCLLTRYLHQRFDPDKPNQSTIGAGFASKKEFVNGKPLVLGIWDTAGQEQYQSMAKMYYRGAVAAILCYDITDKSSFDRARFWAGEMKFAEPECKLYLCGCKKDIVDDCPSKREVERSMAQPLADDFQSRLLETSSSTGENIDELFQLIARYIAVRRQEEARKHKQTLENSVKLDENEGRSKGVPGCCPST